ncbi:HpcH/HpaI aldolase family protein [Burkholderia sp. MR1-5-21]
MIVSKDLRSMLSEKEQGLLGWSEVADPVVVGMLGRAGFDAVLLDAQHGLHDWNSLQAGITEATLCGIPSLVRVGVGATALAARALDMGAAGVVAPMINSAEEAQRFVDEVKYPPVGRRSWGPSRAMQLAGIDHGTTFLAGANDRTALIAMVETRGALENLADILAVPGLDGILVGPGDLSIALSNGTLDPNGSAVRSAMKEIVQKTRQHGKIACAYAANPVRASELLADGFHLVSAGYDGSLIENAFRQAAAAARNPVAG